MKRTKVISSRLGILLCVLMFSRMLYSECPRAWEEDIRIFQYVMPVMARVYDHSAVLKLPGSKIAVFYGEELRGVTDYDDQDGYYFYNLTVRVSDTAESGYTFKFYHPEEDKVYDLVPPSDVLPLAFRALGYGKFNDQFDLEPLVLTLESPEPAGYTVTVIGGTGSATVATAGEPVTVTARTVTVDGAARRKFIGWNASGVVLEDAASPVVQFEMPASDVTLTALYEEFPFVFPDGWVPVSGDTAMTVFGSVKLPDGTFIDCAESLVACFDSQGNCRGIGSADDGLSQASGHTVYCLQVGEGIQQKGLNLYVWNNLTQEIIGICQTLDVTADTAGDEVLVWEALYTVHDASNPDSPYFCADVFGDDPAGTVFSLPLRVRWEHSIIRYDCKLRLHGDATDGCDETLDTELPPHLPPYRYEEYACFQSADGIGLQVDSRSATEHRAVWTMCVTVPERKPVILDWAAAGIPEGWQAVVEAVHETGAAVSADMMSQTALRLEETGTWRLVFTFTDNGAEEVCVCQLTVGWNVITPQVNLNEQSRQMLLAMKPMLIVSSMYVLAAEKDLLPGTALWIYSGSRQSMTLRGTAVADWTLSVPEGWSLVGAVEAVTADQMAGTVSSAWQWTPAGYRQVTSLTAGCGYWVYGTK